MTAVLAPAPFGGEDPSPHEVNPVLTARLAGVLDDLAEHLGFEDTMSTLDDLTGRWATVVDALSGVPGVTPLRLRYDLYCLADVLRRLRALLPAEDVYPW